jgi:hypothetical protein
LADPEDDELRGLYRGDADDADQPLGRHEGDDRCRRGLGWLSSDAPVVTLTHPLGVTLGIKGKTS